MPYSGKPFRLAAKAFGVEGFITNDSSVSYLASAIEKSVKGEKSGFVFHDAEASKEYSDRIRTLVETIEKSKQALDDQGLGQQGESQEIMKLQQQLVAALDAVSAFSFSHISPTDPYYIPAERLFLSSLEYAWPGLMSREARVSVNLPEVLLSFANQFLQAKQEQAETSIPFLRATYLHENGKDFVREERTGAKISLGASASGLQAVVPVAVVIAQALKQEGKTRNFLIEEPELNLFPAGQRDFVNYLVANCTTDNDDLLMTTHSPFVLTALNIMLEAYQVGTTHPELRAEVAAILPEHFWLNPDDFAAYYVDGPAQENAITPIFDRQRGIIPSNQIDGVTGELFDQFQQLTQLKRKGRLSARINENAA